MLKPMVVSWGYEPVRPQASPVIDLFGWIGTDDPLAYLSVPVVIAFQQKQTSHDVRSARHAVASQTRARREALMGLPQISPDSLEWWVQMCIAPLPADGQLPARELQRGPWEEYQVEVPIVGWRSGRFVRLSIQANDSAADVARLLDGLSNLLLSVTPG